MLCRLVLLAVTLLLSLPVRSEPLQATLVVTAHGQELFQSWENPTGEPFNVVPVKVAKRGVFLSAVVMFRDCAGDASGHCDVTVDLTAYDPQGKVYGELVGEELWKGKAAPKPGFTQLGVGYMGLVIEPDDPSGTYRLVAVARDLNVPSSVTSEASFVVE